MNCYIIVIEERRTKALEMKTYIFKTRLDKIISSCSEFSIVIICQYGIVLEPVDVKSWQDRDSVGPEEETVDSVRMGCMLVRVNGGGQFVLVELLPVQVETVDLAAVTVAGVALHDVACSSCWSSSSVTLTTDTIESTLNYQCCHYQAHLRFTEKHNAFTHFLQ